MGVSFCPSPTWVTFPTYPLQHFREAVHRCPQAPQRNGVRSRSHWGKEVFLAQQVHWQLGPRSSQLPWLGSSVTSIFLESGRERPKC